MEEGEPVARSAIPPRQPRFDVKAESQSRRWLRPFGPGQWVYAGGWVDLFRAFQAEYVRTVRSTLGFEEFAFPRILPLRLADNLRLSTYRPGLTYGVVALEENSALLGFLDPLQNITMYELFRGQSLADENLPVKMIETLGGWTWRNEDPNELEDAIRTREFLRVECAFLGRRGDVPRLRHLVRQEITGFLDVLALPWRVVVGIGCLESPEMASLRAVAATPDDVPVHDVEVPLGADRWLEVAGCSVEADSLIDEFGITAQSGAQLASGCCGIGLNRLVHLFLAHHGFERSGWPQAARGML